MGITGTSAHQRTRGYEEGDVAVLDDDGGVVADHRQGGVVVLQLRLLFTNQNRISSINKLLDR